METSILRSASLQSLFGRHIQISCDSSDVSFCNALLSVIGFNDFLDKIRNLSKGVELKRDIPTGTANIEPGTVYVFDVDVAWEGKEVKINERERNALKRHQFFTAMNKTTKVIWIHSESIRMVDAKLKVFQKYEQKLCRENILLYHDFEENKDDIFRLSGRQRLDFLHENTKSLKENVSGRSLHHILSESVNRTLTQDRVRELCDSVDLHYKQDHVGNGADLPYTCYSRFTVDAIRLDLVEKTLEVTAKFIGTDVCRGILQHIELNVQEIVDQRLSRLNDRISSALYAFLKTAVKFPPRLAVSRFRNIIHTAMSYVSIYFQPVNVNSKDWRQEVADEIFNVISRIYNEIVSCLKEICDLTQLDIESLCEEIEKIKKAITLSDLEKQVKEWKKREVIKNREKFLMTYSSVLSYIAGTKNGKDVVKVFLDEDDEDAIRLFIESTYYEEKPTFHFINVRRRITEERLKMLKEKVKQKPVAPSIAGSIRNNIDKIIHSEGERLIATYSNVTGLGIDRMLLENGRFGDPCIVFYCFDKTLVPFGEEELPTHLKGYPVDIREEFIMFGYCCTDCRPLIPGCSIGIPRNEKTGSVGFFVRSTESSSDHGILTAAHVALNEEDMALSNEGLLHGIHQIIHPSCQDSAATTIIGTVSRGICKNIGLEETGVDAAYVKFNMPASGVKIDLTIATDHDLPLDDKNDIFVSKTGRTSGYTIGILKSAGRYPSIISRTYFGRTFNFRSCYYIEDLGGELFFKLGDSGSGVFLMKGKKPLGIGFAIGLCGTYVCRISEILDEFNVTIYDKN